MNDLVLSTNDHNAVKQPSFGSSQGFQPTQKMAISSSAPAGKTANVTSGTNTAQSFVDGKTDLKKKKTADLMPTIRFELKLEPPTSDQFSEFNYNKLVVKTLKIVKKKSKSSKSEVSDMDEAQRKSQSINKNSLSILENDFILEKCKILSLLSHFRKKVILSKEEETNENNLLNTDLAPPETNDGFSINNMDDNDDDSADSENSVNNGTSKPKKSKKKSNQYDSENTKYKLKNFNYLGQGYDEEDSFIDNSEAQDERVPSDMAPKKGGFYINKGNLKMEKIEEQKLKKKAKKQQNALNNKLEKAKKTKVINDDEDSSTDEDFNPNEDEAKNGENDVDMSEEVDDSSDDSSESDSDSDSEKSDDDESDTSEISEVSGTDELKNEEEIKLRNQKRVKTNLETNGKPSNENDSSCEIIDIRSRSNSCSSTKNQKGNKRRMIDDDDENENEETDDNTAGKENIENKVTSNMDTKNPTSSNVNLNSSSQRNVKHKRRKEHANLPSGMSSELSTKTPQQHAKDIQNGSIIKNESMAENLNLSHQQPKQNNINQRRSLPNEINSNLRNDVELSHIVPAHIKELIEKFINSYRGSNSLTGQNIWTDESKSLLFKIYKDCGVTLTTSERPQIFNYISSKIGKTRESLMRHCRNQHSKEQQSQSQLQPQQQQQQQQSSQSQSQATTGTRPTSELKQAYYQKLNSTNQLTINDLTEELRNKLMQIDNAFKAFKSTSDTTNKFFESHKTNQLIHSIDNMTRMTTQNTTNLKRLIREFTIEFLCKLFEMTRDTLVRTINQIRTQHIGNQIQNKIAMLKKAIDEEMPKQITKHMQAHEDYLRNKAAFEAIQQAAGSENEKKKINPPRKKFEWNVKTRDLYLQITNLKSSQYRSTSKPSHQPGVKVEPEEEAQKKNEYLKNFLLTSIIVLWPDNWMQMNVLLHINQQKGHNSQGANKNTTSSVTQSTANNSTSSLQKPFVTNGAIINLASKSGKQVKLEHQPLTKPQIPPSNQQSSTPNQKPVSKQATPQSNRSLQIPLTSSDISTQPITNLTNTRPNTPKQSQHISPTSKKNVYDNLVTQYKGKPTNASPVMNLEKALNNTQTINTSTPSQISNKSPNSLTLQQQHQQKLYRQQQIELTNIFNASNLPNSQFNLTSALNYMMSPNNSYSKNANSNN